MTTFFSPCDRSADSPPPLSDYACSVLTTLKFGPRPRQEFNSGGLRAIEARGLVESYQAPTPYKTRKGTIAFLRLTEAGRLIAKDLT